MEAIILAILTSGSCVGAVDAACDQAEAIASRVCEVEDDTNCFWHGALHGNGQGRSFVSFDGKPRTIKRSVADLFMRAQLQGVSPFVLAAEEARLLAEIEAAEAAEAEAAGATN